MKSMFLLTTCGTSLFTNDSPPEVRDQLRAVANETELYDEVLLAHLDERVAKLRSGSLDREPAEISSIDAILARHPPDRVHHLLLHTNTTLGLRAAEGLQALLQDRGHVAELQTAQGLRTDDEELLQEALSALMKTLPGVLKDWRASGATVLFNLTGGFKSLSGFLQALGMLYADRCVYKFEDASLIEIPRLPVRIEEHGALLRPYLTVFRRWEVDLPTSGLNPDPLLFDDYEDGFVPGVWGDVLWVEHRAELLSQPELPMLCARLRLTKRAAGEWQALPNNRRVETIAALDELAANLENGRLPGKAHQIKALKGNPCPPATHELYLWSDGAAGRAFGHYEIDNEIDKSFLVDRIGNHL